LQHAPLSDLQNASSLKNNTPLRNKIENPFSSRERKELFPDAVFAAKQQKNKLAR